MQEKTPHRGGVPPIRPIIPDFFANREAALYLPLQVSLPYFMLQDATGDRFGEAVPQLCLEMRAAAMGRHHLRQLKPMVAATASGQPACTRARYARTERPFSSAVFSHSSSGLGDMSRVPSVAALSPDQPRLRRALNVLKAIPFSSATGQAGRPLSNSARLSLFRFSNAPRSNGNSTCLHRTVQSLVPSSASANSTTLGSASASGARP